MFVALDSELNREVALKQILDRHADDPVSRQRAVLSLRRAIEGGYRNIAKLTNDPNWHPIQHRPEFQTLLCDLAFPAEPFAR